MPPRRSVLGRKPQRQCTGWGPATSRRSKVPATPCCLNSTNCSLGCHAPADHFEKEPCHKTIRSSATGKDSTTCDRHAKQMKKWWRSEDHGFSDSNHIQSWRYILSCLPGIGEGTRPCNLCPARPTTPDTDTPTPHLLACHQSLASP